MDMWVTKPQLIIIKTMRLLTLHLAPLRVPNISAFTRIWHFWSVKNRSINFRWCTFYFMNNSVLADAETIALNKCLIIWWTSYCQRYELFNINTLVLCTKAVRGNQTFNHHIGIRSCAIVLTGPQIGLLIEAGHSRNWWGTHSQNFFWTMAEH